MQKRFLLSLVGLFWLGTVSCAHSVERTPPTEQNRLAVIVNEMLQGEAVAAEISVSEVLLVDRLRQAGFSPVPWKVPSADHTDPWSLMKDAEGGAAFRSRLSAETGADRAVILKATTAQNDISGLPIGPSRFVSYNATLQILAIDLKSGIALASAMATKPGLGLSKEVAMTKAIEKAMDALLGEARPDTPAPFFRELKARR